MATAAGVKAFDWNKFRKFVRSGDSTSAAERETAFRQAMKMCLENDPPLKFYEAIVQAFGTNDDELNAAVDRITELESQITELEAAGAALADGLAVEQELNERLRAGKARRKEEEKSSKKWWSDQDASERWGQSADAAWAFLIELFEKCKFTVEWTLPNILTLILAIDIAGAWIWELCTESLNYPDISVLLFSFRIALFIASGIAIYLKQGRSVFWVKCWLWALSWWIFVTAAAFIQWGNWVYRPHMTQVYAVSMIAPPLWWMYLDIRNNTFLIVLLASIDLILLVRLSLSDFSNRVLLRIERKKGRA